MSIFFSFANFCFVSPFLCDDEKERAFFFGGTFLFSAKGQTHS